LHGIFASFHTPPHVFFSVTLFAFFPHLQHISALNPSGCQRAACGIPPSVKFNKHQFGTLGGSKKRQHSNRHRRAAAPEMPPGIREYLSSFPKCL
jgi:hypothetical protein